MSPLATSAAARNQGPSLISHFILHLRTDPGHVRAPSESLFDFLKTRWLLEHFSLAKLQTLL